MGRVASNPFSLSRFRLCPFCCRREDLRSYVGSAAKVRVSRFRAALEARRRSPLLLPATEGRPLERLAIARRVPARRFGRSA
jgi:hypothetical protein